MHWIYWKTTAGKHTHVRTDDPVASPDCTEPAVLLINKGSQRSGGFAVAGRRHVIKERCLLSRWISWATQDVSFRWKQDNSSRASCCADRFPARRNIFIYWLSDQVVMESGSGDFSGGASTRLDHLVTIPAHFFRSISLTFSLMLSFIWHPPHLSPACRHIYNRAAIFLTPPHCHHLYTGHVTLLLSQCVWLKCSRRRNNICDKNFMVSGTSSALWRKRHLFFIFLGCLFFFNWVETRCFSSLLSPNTLKQGGQRDWWGVGEKVWCLRRQPE